MTPYFELNSRSPTKPNLNVNKTNSDQVSGNILLSLVTIHKGKRFYTLSTPSLASFQKKRILITHIFQPVNFIRPSPTIRYTTPVSMPTIYSI